MTKGELIERVVKSTGLPATKVKSVVDTVFSEITKALKKKDSVAIVGFGTFQAVKRSARIGHNPKTGEKIKIKAQFSPKFKAGKGLKDAVK